MTVRPGQVYRSRQYRITRYQVLATWDNYVWAVLYRSNGPSERYPWEPKTYPLSFFDEDLLELQYELPERTA